MKSTCCGANAEQRERRRLHYCGTCKTMGRLYGQGSRFFLNYDAVFLGELLTALTPQPEPFAAGYISRNCLAIPTKSQLPLPLQYAATANVLLTEFKLIDHIADTRSKAARATQFLFSRPFRQARKLLDTWRFPLRELCAQLQSQTSRERETNLTLERVAEPTATATRLIFQQGAVLIDARDETVRAMASIGDLFGRIVYVIDALQDREKDVQSGDFNALMATATSVPDARLQLTQYRNAMVEQLRALPIAASQANVFVARLNHNLAPLLSGEKVVVVGGEQGKAIRRRARGRKCCGDGCECSWGCCEICGDEGCNNCCDLACCTCEGCACEGGSCDACACDSC